MFIFAPKNVFMPIFNGIFFKEKGGTTYKDLTEKKVNGGGAGNPLTDRFCDLGFWTLPLQTYSPW